MNTEPDHSKSAARALRPRSPVEVPDSPDTRHAIVAAMETAMQAAKRDQLSRSRRWVTYAAAAAVLAVVCGGAVWLRASMRPAVTTVMATPTSQGTLTAPGQPAQALISGVGLPEASRLTTPASGAATLDFSTGTHVTLGGGSELTLEAVDARQRLYLATGRLDAKVAHVAKGSSFVVATRDTEVEVKGTAFSVEVVPAEAECARGATTRVTVTEGVVSVRFAGQEVLLHGGEQWPPCAALADDSTEASRGSRHRMTCSPSGGRAEEASRPRGGHHRVRAPDAGVAQGPVGRERGGRAHEASGGARPRRGRRGRARLSREVPTGLRQR